MVLNDKLVDPVICRHIAQCRNTASIRGRDDISLQGSRRGQSARTQERGALRTLTVRRFQFSTRGSARGRAATDWLQYTETRGVGVGNRQTQAVVCGAVRVCAADVAYLWLLLRCKPRRTQRTDNRDVMEILRSEASSPASAAGQLKLLSHLVQPPTSSLCWGWFRSFMVYDPIWLKGSLSVGFDRIVSPEFVTD